MLAEAEKIMAEYNDVAAEKFDLLQSQLGITEMIKRSEVIEQIAKQDLGEAPKPDPQEEGTVVAVCLHTTPYTHTHTIS